MAEAGRQEQAYALYLAYRDPRTPLLTRALIVLVVADAVSPIDPAPEFVPGFGYLDELVVLAAGVALALRFVPEDVVAECRARADDEIDAGATRWVVTGLVIAIWLLLGLLALRALADWP